MDNKTKTRRIKTTAWAAFMLPFVAIGASLVAKSAKATLIVDECRHDHEHLCGDPSYGNSIYVYQNHPFVPAMLPPDQRGLNLATTPGGLGSNLPSQPTPTPYTGNDKYYGYYEQPYFVKDYYANLTVNLPTNNVGNCGYTALVMLLSYYDIYWNEKFIIDQYNSPFPELLNSYDDTSFSSPGVKDYYADPWRNFDPEELPKEGWSQEQFDEYYPKERRAFLDYLDQMKAHTSDNLISVLYDLALNSKIYDFDKEPKPLTNILSMTRLANDYYFPSIGMGTKKAEVISVGYKDFSYLTSDEGEQRRFLREAAIERLVNGQPLMFGGDLRNKNGYLEDPNAKYTSGNGHIAIAYAYNKETDEIIGHMGWKGVPDSTVVNFDKTFETFDGFAYMDVKDKLAFSQRRCCFDVNGVPAYAVDLSSHVHKYKVIAYEDETYHVLKCVAGHIQYEKHSFVPVRGDPTKAKCKVCGKIVDVPFLH